MQIKWQKNSLPIAFTRILGFIIPIIFLSCSGENTLLNSENSPQDEVITFQYQLFNFSRASSGSYFWDVKITNTSNKTITYWILTVEFQTDFPRIFIGSILDQDVNLLPWHSYLATDMPIAVLPKCVKSDTVCAITIPPTESITGWGVISAYAEGE